MPRDPVPVPASVASAAAAAAAVATVAAAAAAASSPAPANAQVQQSSASYGFWPPYPTPMQPWPQFSVAPPTPTCSSSALTPATANQAWPWTPPAMYPGFPPWPMPSHPNPSTDTKPIGLASKVKTDPDSPAAAATPPSSHAHPFLSPQGSHYGGYYPYAPYPYYPPWGYGYYPRFPYPPPFANATASADGSKAAHGPVPNVKEEDGIQQQQESMANRFDEAIECDEEEEEPQFVLTDEWMEYFAEAEARRKKKKQQQKREAKAARRAAKSHEPESASINSELDETFKRGVE